MAEGRLSLNIPEGEAALVDGLVCFAVKEEAEFFNPLSFRVVITGIGKKNAAQAIRAAFASIRPGVALTCGFAGGLNPRLARGTIAYCEDEGAGFSQALQAMGAVPARFHCADHLLPTAAEKRALRESTGADAVEMESAVIRTLCKQFQVPCATIRVILDTAEEDLPLDFAQVMTPEERLSYFRLLGKLVRSPGLVRKLMRFRNETREAARILGTALNNLLAARL